MADKDSNTATAVEEATPTDQLAENAAGLMQEARKLGGTEILVDLPMTDTPTESTDPQEEHTNPAQANHFGPESLQSGALANKALQESLDGAGNNREGQTKPTNTGGLTPEQLKAKEDRQRVATLVAMKAAQNAYDQAHQAYEEAVTNYNAAVARTEAARTIFAEADEAFNQAIENKDVDMANDAMKNTYEPLATATVAFKTNMEGAKGIRGLDGSAIGDNTDTTQLLMGKDTDGTAFYLYTDANGEQKRMETDDPRINQELMAQGNDELNRLQIEGKNFATQAEAQDIHGKEVVRNTLMDDLENKSITLDQAGENLENEEGALQVATALKDEAKQTMNEKTTESVKTKEVTAEKVIADATTESNQDLTLEMDTRTPEQKIESILNDPNNLKNTIPLEELDKIVGNMGPEGIKDLLAKTGAVLELGNNTDLIAKHRDIANDPGVQTEPDIGIDTNRPYLNTLAVPGKSPNQVALEDMQKAAELKQAEEKLQQQDAIKVADVKPKPDEPQNQPGAPTPVTAGPAV